MALVASAADLAHRLGRIMDFLEADQTPDGEFRAVRHFHGPVEGGTEPSEYPGWHRFGTCPFFTATIVYHLTEWNDPRGSAICRRACEHLARQFERGLVRYVLARSASDIWFPTDIDDTCLVRRVLRDHGWPLPAGDDVVLRNRTRRGGFYTWFVPRWRHLLHPIDLLWLTRDWCRWSWKLIRQSRLNAARLITEYHGTTEPAVDANVLLYFGSDSRIQGLERVLLDALRTESVRLEYYDSMIGAYFHAARAFDAGARPLAELGPEIHQYILDRQDETGRVQSGLDTAMSALALMYLGYWTSDALNRALQYLMEDPMHTAGWLPQPYVNPVNRAFSDGSPGLTATLYGDALRRALVHTQEAR
jgi:hypothetical protein